MYSSNTSSVKGFYLERLVVIIQLWYYILRLVFILHAYRTEHFILHAYHIEHLHNYCLLFASSLCALVSRLSFARRTS